MMRESLAEQVHPHTGEPIVPVGFVNGRPVWPIMGAAEDDAGGDSGDEDNSDDDTGDEPEDDADKDDANESKKSDEDARKDRANALVRSARAENKRLKKDRDDLAAKLKEIEDKDKGAAEKLTESVKDLTTKIEAKDKTIEDLALRNAFLSDTTFKWKNPVTALKLVDLSKVEIDDDGEVEGMTEALKALAKSDPYLLETSKDDEDEDEDKQPPAAGEAPKTKQTKGNANRDKLIKKYPALRR